MKDLFFKTLMLKGEAGGTIRSIEKTSTSGLVDTYTITLDDGSTQTFEVTNGNSIVSVEKTSTSGYTDTYTITYEDGSTSTFEVTNGEDGSGYEVPTNSVIYYDSSSPIPEGYEGVATSPDNPDISALYRLSQELEGSHSGDNANVEITNFNLTYKGRLVVVSFIAKCTATVAAWSKLTTINKAPMNHIYALGLNMSDTTNPDIRLQIRNTGEIYFAGAPVTNVLYSVNAVFYMPVS